MHNHADEALAHLTALGFSEAEARVYVALLTHGPLSGYEVSKRSGVPRPNVYPALQRLEARGAVDVFAVRRGARYAARAAPEVLERLEHSYREQIRGAGTALLQLAGAASEPVAVALAGEAELLDYARTRIATAETQVLLAVTPATAPLLAAAITNALSRGIRVTTLCLQACPTPCGACQGTLFRQNLEERADAGWMLAVVDDREMVAADLARPGTETTGIVTRHPSLVRMAAGWVRDGVAAAELIQELLGHELNERAPNAVASLAGTLDGPALADSRHRSWLDRMRARLRIERR
jgi:Cd2+/Zn2+-exporting ATPase